MIILDMNKDLGLEFEPSEGPRVHDSITISLKGTAIGMRGLWNEPTGGVA
jgi:hypothetical protein